jgi:hypothetical protein
MQRRVDFLMKLAVRSHNRFHLRRNYNLWFGHNPICSCDPLFSLLGAKQKDSGLQ